MLTKEQYLEAHSKFYDLRQEENTLYSKYLSYDESKIEIPYKVDVRLALIFKPMAEDFVKELLYEINGFCSILKDLCAWEKVLKDYPTGEMKCNMLAEIINPISLVALNMPYAIKGRFIYASVSLLHETAFLIDEKYEWKNFLKKNIYIEDLEKFKPLSEKQNWESFALFLDKLKQINTKEHQADTSNFRNRFHHLLPPNIELGLSSFVRRIEKEGNPAYGIGPEPPLPISKLLISLQSEHEACIKTFQAFWLLLKDQLEIWKQKCVPVE